MNTILLNGIERDVLTESKAKEMGYRPMTYVYHPENELWMLHNIARDMDKAGHTIVCVMKRDPKQHSDDTVWLEVWRRVFRKTFKS